MHFAIGESLNRVVDWQRQVRQRRGEPRSGRTRARSPSEDSRDAAPRRRALCM